MKILNIVYYLKFKQDLNLDEQSVTYAKQIEAQEKGRVSSPKKSLKSYLRLSLKCIFLTHGLQTPNEAIFSSKSQTFGLGQTISANKFLGLWGIFGQFISTHFGTVSPLNMFSNNQPLILQKTKPLYPYLRL